MKLCLPKQHGAWAMLLIPFWLGAVASELTWFHIPFFIGWLFLYLATYPMLLLFKKKKIQYYAKWTTIYLVPAIVLLLFPLWERPSIVIFGLIMLPFFIINVYYSSKNRERALGNDISAIMAFSIAGLASSYLANGEVNSSAVIVFITTVLFFTGSTFYVKTMIREKRNQVFKLFSWIYHIAVVILWGMFGQWFIAVAFLPSLLRAFAFNGRALTPKQIGIIEIINAVFFFIIILFVIY
ncbi:YwiC-like family protein [Bacillus sp. FJAT-29790]|uniref:YwiC-like family protein n=1 Tax=Bacillus sp. FJAT-29790 TaxID=1895002 RepID=UPI001C225930|nr:YwiC-like family protein [Bacillus sp. FJAT-29790]MBU8877443.1 YwiC-like family protein [Bacillus sp. FJAT-29790]